MLKVFKYECPVEERFTLYMPQFAKILAFQAQYDKPVIWALVDPDQPSMRRDFRLAGTGHPIEEEEANLVHLGTCQMHMGNLVWHLFELIRF